MELRTSSKAASVSGDAGETAEPSRAARRSGLDIADFTGSCAAMAGPRSVQMGLLTVILTKRRRIRRQRSGRGAVA